jgi:hypothetical protein
MNIKSLLAVAAFTAFAAGSTAAKADLIVNGGFETGDTTGWTIHAQFTDAAPSGFNGVAAHSGNWYLAMGDTSTSYPYGTVSQTVSDHAGDTLALTYWFSSQDTVPNYFDAEWNGTVLAGSVLTNVGVMDWTEYQFMVTATGSDTLTFREQNVGNFSALDDVSLNAVSQSGVPEPATLSLFGLALAALGCKRRRT